MRPRALLLAAIVTLGLSTGPHAQGSVATVFINEVESSGGVPGDWVELVNTGTSAADISGWRFLDNDDTHTAYVLPAGTVIAGGGYYLLEEAAFGFGLGGADSVRLFGPTGSTPIDSYTWTVAAATTYGRCPNGTGAFTTTTSVTKGAANDCGTPAPTVFINEVESSGGVPGDWVELVNTGTSAANVSGWRFLDNDDTHTAYILPAGTVIPAGGYYLLEEAAFGFGLGGADSARLFAPTGSTPIDSYTWTVAAATTYGRCPNGTGAFTTTTSATKGAANICPGSVSPLPWPGDVAVQTVDGLNVFGGNLSGLVYEGSGRATPGILWGARNGPGALFRLIFDGTIWTPDSANAWSAGKLLHYPDGTGEPDAEGVTFAGPGSAGGIYVATERNNSANSISRNSILRFDPTSVGASLSATHEWNLTTDLPAVGANLGMEAITWIPDLFLVSRGFVDESKGPTSLYNPADYPNHGTGLFFVGLEANGVIYAYALDHVGGGFRRVATIASGFPGVMDLQFDRELNQLWAICDDGCLGRSAVLRIDTGTGRFVPKQLFERPAGMPNLNNEGFAFTPLSECVADSRPVFWADDSETGGHSIRRGTLTCTPPRRFLVDADGDGKSDLAVFRPSNGTWFIKNSTTGYTTNSVRQWGLTGDVPVPGDYDGDGKMDPAVYRPSTGGWYILQSRTDSMVTYALGLSDDVPVPGDYDGDGKADPAVYRRSTGVWSILTSSTGYAVPATFQWGLLGDIPVPGDYDGDDQVDLAVYRPSIGTWYVLTSSSGSTTSFSYQWGLSGDVPVPGDYDGDGIGDLAVYRPAIGMWFIRQSTTSFTTSVLFQWGLRADVPVPADYDGDGKTDLGVYRPSTGTWFIEQSSTGYAPFGPFQWGLGGDIPAPNAPFAYALRRSTLATLVQASDFDADRRSDLTVYRPSTGTWFTLRSSTNDSAAFTLGASTDTPVTGDFDGDGTTDAAVYTPATGIWSIRRSSLGATTYQWGLTGDVPVPGDYDGDGTTDLAVYRPTSGTWFIRQSSRNFAASLSFQWGLGGDVTVPGDYDGDGVTDLAVFRPSTSTWFVLKSSTSFTTSASFQWGLSGDIAVPGDYDGDSTTDLAMFRPSTGTWFIRQSTTTFTTSVALQWGLSADTPVPGDFDGDGKTDLAVYRPSSGTWFLLMSSTNFTTSASVQWGLTGDVPILKRP